MKVHLYGEINHPHPHYHCTLCGGMLVNPDRVVLTHIEDMMVIVHEKCYENWRVKWRDTKSSDTESA